MLRVVGILGADGLDHTSSLCNDLCRSPVPELKTRRESAKMINGIQGHELTVIDLLD